MADKVESKRLLVSDEEVGELLQNEVESKQLLVNDEEVAENRQRSAFDRRFTGSRHLVKHNLESEKNQTKSYGKCALFSASSLLATFLFLFFSTTQIHKLRCTIDPKLCNGDGDSDSKPSKPLTPADFTLFPTSDRNDSEYEDEYEIEHEIENEIDNVGFDKINVTYPDNDEDDVQDIISEEFDSILDSESGYDDVDSDTESDSSDRFEPYVNVKDAMTQISLENLTDYIYVYDVPDEILHSTRTSCDYCLEDPGYNTERTIINAISQSRYVTTDPMKAKWKLVPMFYACKVTCPPVNNKRGLYHAKAVMNYVKGLPYWNEKNGRDHIFVFSQDKGAYRMAELDRDVFNEIRKGLFLQTLHSFMPGRPEALISGWDIIVPSVAMSQDAKPVQTLEEAEQKSYLAFWRGGVFPKGKYRFRVGMYDRYQNSQIVHIRTGHSPEYREELENSRFCLYVPGHLPQRWSGSLGNIIRSGCLILVVNDCTEMPFSELLPWNDFSARLSQQEFLGETGEALVREFNTEKRLGSIIDNYKKYRENLMYNLPPRKDDALDQIIKSLRLRENALVNKDLHEFEQHHCKKIIDEKQLGWGADCKILSKEEMDVCKHGYWVHDAK
mmetsp:Transcript_35670/g.44237  ORF Transcript_35670/g.44237 Transcript_35670/m.44237 type:complete len:613 (-) Transcript_35670:423-2261(-)